jgi:hypothetical protein
MLIDKTDDMEYPFRGVFYNETEAASDDGGLFDDETEEAERTEEIVLDTECDILPWSSTSVNGLVIDHTKIYFPFDRAQGVPVRKGMFFRATDYTVPFGGKVVEVAPSTLGGCMCIVKGD